MVFAIITDIDDSKRDYTRLYEKIQSLGAWMHYIESTWFVSPSRSMTAKEIFDELHPFTDKEDDYLLVTRIKENYYGWLPTDAWDWIRQRIS